MTPTTASAKRRKAPNSRDVVGTVYAQMHQLMLAEIGVLTALPAELPIDPATGKPDTRAEKRAAHSLDVLKTLLPYCMPKFGTKAAANDPQDDEPPCDASLDID